jgi:hypothetical protein
MSNVSTKTRKKEGKTYLKGLDISQRDSAMMMEKKDYSIMIPSYTQGGSGNRWLSEGLWQNEGYS